MAKKGVVGNVTLYVSFEIVENKSPKATAETCNLLRMMVIFDYEKNFGKSDQ
jgi:hypothetical protein